MGIDLYISEWREYRRLTQADLAQAVGINRVTLARIETGAEPKASTLLGIASALGTTAEALCSRPDQSKEPPDRGNGRGPCAAAPASIGTSPR